MNPRTFRLGQLPHLADLHQVLGRGANLLQLVNYVNLRGFRLGIIVCGSDVLAAHRRVRVERRSAVTALFLFELLAL